MIPDNPFAEPEDNPKPPVDAFNRWMERMGEASDQQLYENSMRWYRPLLQHEKNKVEAVHEAEAILREARDHSDGGNSGNSIS